MIVARRSVFALALLGAGACVGRPAPADAVAATYTNPVLAASGDPAVIRVGNQYVLYLPSNGDGRPGYSAWVSTDLVHWREHGSVFTHPDGQGLWAPDVFAADDGRFYLYYTVVRRGGAGADPGEKDIGVAVASSPFGPFKALGLILGGGGAYIDPHLFQDDDGALYLFFKERRADRGGTQIRAMRMKTPYTPDRATLTTVLEGQPGWEHELVEQPWVYRYGGRYYLFYSAASGSRPSYAIGVATASSPLGRYARLTPSPLMRSDPASGVIAPGATSIVTDGAGQTWMVYRQKRTRRDRWNDRFVTIDRLRFAADGGVAITPTRGTPEPTPVPLEDTPLPVESDR